MFFWMVSNYSPSLKTQKLLFKTLVLKPSKLLGFQGWIFPGWPRAPPVSITQPAPAPFVPCSRLRQLPQLSSTLCDTNRGKLPGNSATSPLLLRNFLIRTNHMKQFYRSGRNLRCHTGGRLFRDTFFPHGGVSFCVKLRFPVTREETVMVTKSSESHWGQRPKLMMREDPQHPHSSCFDLSCGN